MNKFFSAILMVLPLCAFANNTWHLLRSDRGVKTYIDCASIHGKHEIREFKYLEEYSRPQKLPASAISYYAVEGHEIVNCRNWAYKIVSVSYYGKHHQLLSYVSAPRKRVPFVFAPDRSIAESDVVFTCLHVSLYPQLQANRDTAF